MKALVYVSALAPDVGEAVIDVQKYGPQSPGWLAPTGYHGFVWFDPDAFGPPSRVTWIGRGRHPRCDTETHRRDILRATAEGAAWHDRPSWYLLSTSDQALSPELQRFMAQRMGARTTEVPSSHMSPLSHAEAVIAMIEAAASL